MEDEWKGMYVRLARKKLSPIQLQILEYGPKNLFQTYELVCMRQDYLRIMKQGEI